MEEIKYNPPMTAGRLREALKDVPDDFVLNVANSEGTYTDNVFVWVEADESRKYVDLMGFKPYSEMSPEERERCGVASPEADEMEKRREELVEKRRNPTLLIQSENAFSVVAKAEYQSVSRPFKRYLKHRDENGVFILFNQKKRIYEKDWKRGF